MRGLKKRELRAEVEFRLTPLFSGYLENFSSLSYEKIESGDLVLSSALLPWKVQTERFGWVIGWI